MRRNVGEVIKLSNKVSTHAPVKDATASAITSLGMSSVSTHAPVKDATQFSDLVAYFR